MKKHSVSLTPFVLLIVCLSLAEVILILLGVLPPALSYSTGNILFVLSRLAVIIYAGVLFSNISLKKSALVGLVLGFVMVFVICLASLISKSYFNKPILGISAPSTGYLLIMLVIVVLENTLLGALVALCAGWIAKKLRRL